MASRLKGAHGVRERRSAGDATEVGSYQVVKHLKMVVSTHARVARQQHRRRRVSCGSKLKSGSSKVAVQSTAYACNRFLCPLRTPKPAPHIGNRLPAPLLRLGHGPVPGAADEHDAADNGEGEGLPQPVTHPHLLAPPRPPLLLHRPQLAGQAVRRRPLGRGWVQAPAARVPSTSLSICPPSIDTMVPASNDGRPTNDATDHGLPVVCKLLKYIHTMHMCSVGYP